jgi:hypothetical protein
VHALGIFLELLGAFLLARRSRQDREPCPAWGKIERLCFAPLKTARHRGISPKRLSFCVRDLMTEVAFRPPVSGGDCRCLVFDWGLSLNKTRARKPSATVVSLRQSIDLGYY